MPDYLPKHYTCTKCYTVAILPADGEGHAAKCPICSPNEVVLYKRGIVLDPSKPVVQPTSTPEGLVSAPAIPLKSAAVVADSKIIDSLTARVAELEKENAGLKATLAQKEVRVPQASVPAGVAAQVAAVPAQQQTATQQAANLVPPIAK